MNGLDFSFFGGGGGANREGQGDRAQFFLVLFFFVVVVAYTPYTVITGTLTRTPNLPPLVDKPCFCELLNSCTLRKAVTSLESYNAASKLLGQM